MLIVERMKCNSTNMLNFYEYMLLTHVILLQVYVKNISTYIISYVSILLNDDCVILIFF